MEQEDEMASEWFCKIMGEEWGPMSTMELMAIAQRGRLSRDDQVRRADCDTWVRAELVRGLLNVPPVAPTATPDHSVTTPKASPAKRSVRKSLPALYWVKTEQRISGPFPSEALRHLAERGALTPSHLVSKDRVKWARATIVQGLTFGQERPDGIMLSVRSADLLDESARPTESPSTNVFSESVAEFLAESQP
jgi:hypothetical protein